MKEKSAATAHAVKPLGCDPARIKGMSEKLIVSHYENNYDGAVKRLNLIEPAQSLSVRQPRHPQTIKKMLSVVGALELR